MITRWTPKLAARKSIRKLQALEERAKQTAIAIAYEWMDEDQTICDLCDWFSDAVLEGIRELREAIDETVEERAEAQHQEHDR